VASNDLPVRRPVPVIISPGVRWLAAACRLDGSPLAPPPLPWEDVDALARRHRVESLLAEGLRQRTIVLPEEFANRLHDEVRRIAAHNLQAALESRRLRDAFAEAGVDLLFLKGLTLSQLAYGKAMLKMSRDLDLLVPPQHIGAATALLTQLGYRAQAGASGTNLERWHRWSKESGWVGPAGLLVELHSRLTDSPRLLSGIDGRVERQEVAVVPGITLPTLGPEALPAYLAVHGASSAWFRLKWISDLQALLAPLDEDGVSRAYRMMRAHGAGRAAGLALLLLRRLYDVPLSSELEATLEGDWRIRWLLGEALRQLNAPTEPTDRRGGTVGIHLSQLLIGDDAAFPIREGARRLGEIIYRRISAT